MKKIPRGRRSSLVIRAALVQPLYVKRLVVLTALCLFAGFAACSSESRSLHRVGDEPGGQDPGTATDLRQSLYPGLGSGFLVGLGSDGTYRNAHISKGEPLGIHETPGGGSLIFFDDAYPPGPDPNVVAYYSDGAPAWTLSTDTEYYSVLVASTTRFAMWGVEDVRAQSPLGVDERSFNPDNEFVVRRYAF